MPYGRGGFLVRKVVEQPTENGGTQRASQLLIMEQLAATICRRRCCMTGLGVPENMHEHPLDHIIGFVAGIIAKLLHPGPNEPSGFVLTTILGIVGAFVATYLGQAIGWYNAGEGAGLVGAVVGAIIVLVVWGFLAPRDRRAA